MKAFKVLIWLLCLGIILWQFSACSEEAPMVDSISLSNLTIYELLPKDSHVGKLSSNIEDLSIRYRLISGEGDTDNQQFKVDGFTLKTNEELNYEDGAVRNIRLQVNLGESSYEESFQIAINDFQEDEYPSVTSPSFEFNQRMPNEFGGDDGNVSPDLEIFDIPSATVSMVITMNDLDAGSSWHWAVWNVPPSKNSIARNDSFGAPSVYGNNDYGEGYTGPFPPSIHRYLISVYFLDVSIDLDPSKYSKLNTEILEHVFARATLIGLYL